MQASRHNEDASEEHHEIADAKQAEALGLLEMAIAYAMSQPATSGSQDARWRAFRQLASFQRWPRSLRHSA